MLSLSLLLSPFVSGFFFCLPLSPFVSGFFFCLLLSPFFCLSPWSLGGWTLLLCPSVACLCLLLSPFVFPGCPFRQPRVYRHLEAPPPLPPAVQRDAQLADALAQGNERLFKHILKQQQQQQGKQEEGADMQTQLLSVGMCLWLAVVVPSSKP